MNTNETSFDINVDDRIRSISTNAIQEARIAKGRGTLPFLDKDSRIQHMIERLLHELTSANDSMSASQHYPLVEKDQPRIGHKLDSMNEILDKMEDEIIGENTLVKATLPKTKI